MDKFRLILKENFRLPDMFIIAIISFLLSAGIYKLLFPICTYKNLKDFYIGTTIYMDHNKYLDIGIFFIYLFIYLAIYILNFFKIPKIKTNSDILKYKKFINVILILISIFLIIQFIFHMCIPYIPDSHHYGEQFATYWLNKVYGMKYYKDIMLVHGYYDIIPSWIADNILGELTYEKERISVLILSFTWLVINTILASFIFKRKWSFIFISSGIFLYILSLTRAMHVVTYVLAFLLLLEKINTKNNFAWNFWFYVICFLGPIYHTTVGSACAIAMLPLLFYRFKKTPKFCIIFWSVCILITCLLFGDSIIAYFHKAQYYISSNLYAFGNFPYETLSIYNLYKFTFAIMSLIISPIIMILAIITKNKKIRFACIYTLIIIICLLNYTLGRLDSIEMPRFQSINLVVISIIVPYILYKYKTKYFYVYNIVIFLLFYNFSYTFSLYLNYYNKSNPLYPSEQIQFVKEHTNENNTILDLNNCGMNYYLAQRKAAIPYTSYYNMVNSKQCLDTLKELIKNPPKFVILIDHSTIIYFDEIRFPLRINKIYHWLFESGLYKLMKTNNALYLIYSPDSYPCKIQYTPNLNILFNKNLYKLPDVWGKSIKTLPMKYVPQSLKINNNTITFNKLINTNSADLLYIKYLSDKPTDFKMHIDNNNFIVKFTSYNNEILIPLDNYPSWLLTEKIKEIHFDTNIPIKIIDAKLYKRN